MCTSASSGGVIVPVLGCRPSEDSRVRGFVDRILTSDR
jgi:hypothetical protein